MEFGEDERCRTKATTTTGLLGYWQATLFVRWHQVIYQNMFTFTWHLFLTHQLIWPTLTEPENDHWQSYEFSKKISTILIRDFFEFCSPSESTSHGPKLFDYSDTHVLDFEPNLKTLCLMAVIENNLDQTFLPQDIRSVHFRNINYLSTRQVYLANN